MENIRETKKKMVWVDGNTLVKVVGEQEANEYLHGTGYQAKLTEFIKERERKLKEEQYNRNKVNKRNCKKRKGPKDLSLSYGGREQWYQQQK